MVAQFTGNADRGNVPNVLMILTDGNSNDQEDTLEAAHDAKRAGFHIITVGKNGRTKCDGTTDKSAALL